MESFRKTQVARQVIRALRSKHVQPRALEISRFVKNSGVTLEVSRHEDQDVSSKNIFDDKDDEDKVLMTSVTCVVRSSDQASLCPGPRLLDRLQLRIAGRLLRLEGRSYPWHGAPQSYDPLRESRESLSNLKVVSARV